MNIPTNVINIKNEIISIDDFESDIQPQPPELKSFDPKKVWWLDGCNVTIIKDKEIVISPSTDEGWIFRLSKDLILKAEINNGKWNDKRGLSTLKIDIYHKDPKQVVEYFMTTLSSADHYLIRTLLKKIKEELDVEVENNIKS